MIRVNRVNYIYQVLDIDGDLRGWNVSCKCYKLVFLRHSKHSMVHILGLSASFRHVLPCFVRFDPCPLKCWLWCPQQLPWASVQLLGVRKVHETPTEFVRFVENEKLQFWLNMIIGIMQIVSEQRVTKLSVGQTSLVVLYLTQFKLTKWRAPMTYLRKMFTEAFFSQHWHISNLNHNLVLIWGAHMRLTFNLDTSSTSTWKSSEPKPSTSSRCEPCRRGFKTFNIILTNERQLRLFLMELNHVKSPG